jgi:predicted transcriptional regulator
MKLAEVRQILEAEWVGGKGSANGSGAAEIGSCRASDLMSDVLTLSATGSLLLTGLATAQVVRTAEVSDFVAVCFVRGKHVQPEVAQLAEERQIPLLVTPLSMFESCGRLYARGLRGANGDREG